MSDSCFCAYGPRDPRCCVFKSERRALEEAHRLGREGKPLPPVPTLPESARWGNAFDQWMGKVENGSD